MRPISIINRGRGPELAHTRITVYDIIPYLEEGWHPSSIAMALGISSPAVRALIQYIEEHKEEVMAENAKIVERIRRGNPPEVEAKRQASHAKVLALREKLQREREQREANGARSPE